MSVLDGFARLIDADDIGVYNTSGTYDGALPAICLENMPTEPDTVIALYQYAGPESSIGLPYDEPSIQVRTRSAGSPLLSRDLCQRIYDTYHGELGITLPDGTYVVSIIGTDAGPSAIGRDENGRHEHTANFRVHIANDTDNRP